MTFQPTKEDFKHSKLNKMKRQKHEADEKHGKNPQAKQMKN